MLRWCGACKKEKTVQDFDSHKKDPSKLLLKCRTCTSYQTKWNKSAKGKAFHLKRGVSEAKRESNKKWANTPAGKAYMQGYHAEYEKTEKCKTRRKAWAKTENGKRNSKIQGKKTAQRLRDDPAKRLAWNIRVRMYSTLKGTLHQSATVIRNTEFPDLPSIRTHFESQLTGEMTMDNYGSVWDLEHTIALIWYDHNDPEDVKRCWSRSNLRPMLCKDNRQKSYKIDDLLCNSVDLQCWPKAWNGCIPDSEEKKRMYARVRGGGRA